MDGGEVWKEIEHFGGAYRVSNRGQVHSVLRDFTDKFGNTRPAPYTGRLLSQSRDRDGYLRVWLRKDGRDVVRPVHVLVCEAFHGRRPERMVAAHLDGSRDNNIADNLAWVTQAENVAHTLEHGTRNSGERNGRAKYSDSDVAEMRRLRRSGWTKREVCERYGISRRHLMKVCNGCTR